MNRFWNFIQDEAGERILLLEGPIDEDNLWGDAITPEDFKNDLNSGDGDVTVWLNSPGGNVFAANQIYNALCEYKSKGKVTVKIDAIAASAASVIAMAGDEVLISPVGMLMIHDPMTMAMGNTKDMEQAIKTLNSVKDSIINAYQLKTGLSHNKISQLMSDETWLPAKQAKALGFVDGILYGKEDEKDGEEEKEESVTIGNTWLPYHARLMGQTIWASLTGGTAEHSDVAGEKPETPASQEKDVESSEAGVIDKDPPKKPNEDEPSGQTDGDNPDNPDEGDDSPDNPSEDPDEQETEEDDSDEDDSKKNLNNDLPEKPVIGMNGKTKDGAMPYELLKRELLFLK